MPTKRLRKAEINPPAPPRELTPSVHEIVQLDPMTDLARRHGAQLVIVTDVRQWGVEAYYLVRTDLGPARARVRVQHGDYQRLGDDRKALWVLP